jgi:cytochrome c-type biogenesis protein CcmH/NrfF
MRFLLGVLMLMISGSALATIDVLQFKDEAQEQQFRQLTEELRCPKCQNNSIAVFQQHIISNTILDIELTETVCSEYLHGPRGCFNSTACFLIYRNR